MNGSFLMPVRKWLIVICVAAILTALFPSSALAPPPRKKGPPKRPPGRAKPGPRPPGPKKRLGKLPPGRVIKARHKPLWAHRRRVIRRARYWHPYYGARYPRWVWPYLGYKYYVGGTDYVIVKEPTVVTETAGQTVQTVTPGPTDVGSEQRYCQIQELVDLVHQWRTMNESAALHRRLPRENAPQEVLTIISAIKERNQLFDRATRSAMRELAEGRSAQADLDAARKYLAELVELVESLPEPSVSASG